MFLWIGKESKDATQLSCDMLLAVRDSLNLHMLKCEKQTWVLEVMPFGICSLYTFATHLSSTPEEFHRRKVIKAP